ncbi:hypothetical protein SAMN05216554_2690 [Herbiconiux ginsengi]|uniref:Uncharacterized protein n=1 Tax=Herbiconiux ginsengi TaxID=381665 RepID=A0A1H3QSW2_9MICO|nr:hypothetical protein SAMN05216554_2690 [Herbiconiux ginsengi]
MSTQVAAATLALVEIVDKIFTASLAAAISWASYPQDVFRRFAVSDHPHTSPSSTKYGR